MTALRERRRRAVLVGGACAFAGILVAAGLGTAGAVAVWHSTDGSNAAPRRPLLTLPTTPTGLLAAVDDDGRLASLAVFVGRPSGVGGSIVTVPINADAAAGMGDERLPLAETFDLDGAGTIGGETEIALGLSIDNVAVVDKASLTEMFAPLGEIEVDVPFDVVDGRGRTVAEQGVQLLAADELAAALTARDVEVPAVQQYRAAGAVWSAIAERAGSGSTDGAVVAAGTAIVATADAGTEAAAAEDLISAVLSGSARHRDLRTTAIDPELNARRTDVVTLDRSELVLVFGQIAPGRVSAPATGLCYRVESPFAVSELEELGWTKAGVAYEALELLLFAKANVLSVDTSDSGVLDVTVIKVNDEALVPDLAGAKELFGDVEFVVAETEIAGIDATVRLGQSFIDFLAERGGLPGPGDG